jgi:hypothetical protein
LAALADLTVYVEHIERELLHQRVTETHIPNTFLLRSALPPSEDAHGSDLSALHLHEKRYKLLPTDDHQSI